MKTLICEIEHYAVHDGPGIRTLVFFKGCPLRCRWCANPETQSAEQEYFFDEKQCIQCKRCQSDSSCECPVGARRPVAKLMSLADVMKEILDDQAFYRTSGGGVTLSGGEVLMHEQFATALLTACRENFINTAIETCGFAPFAKLSAVASLCDTILYDIKMLDKEQHKVWTGCDNTIIINNLRKLSAAHKNIIIRLPLIPGVNDNIKEITAICRLMNELQLTELHILPYHSLARDKYNQLQREYPMPEITAPSSEALLAFKMLAERHNITCHISG